MASQLLLASQLAILQNVNLILCQILGGVHLLHQYTSDILSDGQSAAISQPTNHMAKCQPDFMLDFGGVHLLHQYTSDILSDGQPAAIGQPNSHLTKCQTDPKPLPGGTSEKLSTCPEF